MNNDGSTAGEEDYDLPEEFTCEKCGCELTQNSYSTEYWGAQVLQTEWECKNCN